MVIDWISDKLYSLKRGLRNLYFWIPIVWSLCGCCYSSLFKVMYAQLERMEKVHRKHNPYVGCEKTIFRIRYTRLLLKRLVDHNYSELAFKFHDKKWGELSIVCNDDRTVDFVRPNVNTPEEAAQELQEFRRCLKHENYLMLQDLEQLSTHLYKYAHGWWI